MKYFLYIVFLALSVSCTAQSKQMRLILANSLLLENTVFDTKDSATLEALFATTLSYGQPDGTVESRQEAIKNISHNKSVYVEAIQPTPYDFSMEGDSAIVKKNYKAIEKKTNGIESALNLTITLVWIKEEGKWKLTRREAVENN
jgi:hypothetical protein